MIEYCSSRFSELSILKNSRGNFFHQSGNYVLRVGEEFVIPANRSYIADDRAAYWKDELIHEKVERTIVLMEGELLVDIYGKPLLFVRDKDSVWYSSKDATDIAISSQARQLLDELHNTLIKAGLSSEEHYLGVYGSHRVNLQGVDSDIDLVCWVDWLVREDFTSGIIDGLKKLGYRTSLETGKELEYAVRYARRFGVSTLAGQYLASKRMRLAGPGGIPVSLQCLELNANHEILRAFLEGINEEWRMEEMEVECQVISARASYNLPKVWQLEVLGAELTAISFSWMHQGMGDDKNRFGDKYLLKAALVETKNGGFLYLQGKEHYLLPKALL